ncbi:hypothetical protein D3C81_09490 [compost metagenome]
MSNTVQSVYKSNAFIIAYLLGVEEKVFPRDYADDYRASGEFKVFELIENANVIRAFNRVRQSILRNYSVYKNSKDFTKVSEGYLTNELILLEKCGYRIHSVYSENYDLSEVVNYIRANHDKLLDKVLSDLGIQYKEDVKALFYFYDFTKKTLEKRVTELKQAISAKMVCFPHGVIILKYAKIVNLLRYTLTNDTNMFCTCKAITKNDSEILATEYNWRKYNLAEVAVESVEEEVKQEVKAEISLASNVANKQEDTTDYLKGVLLDSVYEEIFVDCDNTSFFAFVAFVKELEKHNKNYNINLFIDAKSNFLWKIINNILQCPFKINKTFVTRIKESKSVVDMVMAVAINKAIFSNKKQITLISSDSDFYGLLSEYDDVKFSVGYVDSAINNSYLNFLVRNEIPSFDLDKLDVNACYSNYKEITIKYSILCALANNPINKWYENGFLSENMVTAVSFFYNNLVSEIGDNKEELTHDMVQNLMLDVISSMAIEVKEGKVHISYDSIVVAF